MNNITSTNCIKLGEQQEKAFNSICSFIENGSETAFSLIGAAGTGKTLCTSYIIDWLESKGYNYTLCAPTHKAALVMKQYTKRNSNTLHRLLSLSPNIAILDLDLRQLEFVTSKVTDNIPLNGVVICDESSMINDDLFDLLIEKVSDRHSKIVFVGDFCQLLPVKQQYYSKVYSLENSFELTKIYRQSEKNSILPILQRLRTDEISKWINTEGVEGKLIVESNLREFLDLALSQVKTAINSRNILHTKVAVYTNKRIDQYNHAIRKLLWSTDKEYNIGEILTAYENGEYEGTEYWNSMDYIIESEPEYTEVYLPNFKVMKGWNIKLYDSYSEFTFSIFILSRDNSESSFQDLSRTIEELRLRAIEAKQRKSRVSYKYWRKYYDLINSFATPIDLYYDGRLIRRKSFDYGYACTVHRLQGSSFNSIFIDMRNINTCTDNLIRRQLQYVALSRTRKDAYILQ